MNNKVFVIGLDGATLDLIKPWASQGKLPNLDKVMRQGAYGTLRSTIHPLTAPAWTSFMTGKNPGKHGIFDFISLMPDSYQITYNNALSRKSPSLWRMLSDAGKKVIVINVPFTYPPEEVNGILISGLDAPGTKSIFTYPPSLYTQLKQFVGEYVIMAQYRRGRSGYVTEIMRMIKNRTATTKYLMEKYPWDFFMVVFSATDVAQHTFWKYMDPTHPDYIAEEAQRYGNVILNVYQEIDKEIGSIMERLDNHTALFVISDHGAGPFKKAIYLNKWLEIQGLLRFNRQDSMPGSLARLLSHKILGACKRSLPQPVKENLTKLFPEIKAKVNTHLVTSHIDWANTKAFSCGVHGSIIINLKGRQPAGVIAPGDEYEDIRSEIIVGLHNLADPETREKVVEKVHRREKLYHGPYTQYAPDLLVQWKDYAYTAQHDYGQDVKTVFQARRKFEFSPKEHNGSHRLDGIIMVAGKPVKSSLKLSGSQIIDLTPTILYLMKVPIPEDIDGKVLKAAFLEDYLLTHPIDYRKATNEGTTDVTEGTYSEKEAKKIERRLKDLGYL